MINSKVIRDIMGMMENRQDREFKVKYAAPNRHPKYNKRNLLMGYYQHDPGHVVDTYGTENVVPFSDGCCVHLSPWVAVHFGYVEGYSFVGVSQNRMSRQDYLIHIDDCYFQQMLREILPMYLDILKGEQVRTISQSCAGCCWVCMCHSQF